MRLCYVTFPDADARDDVVGQVVDEELAACVTMFDVDSVYRWEGAVEREDEAAALFKTSDENGDTLMERITELHPYDVPAVIDIPAGTTGSYADYLDAETR